MPLITHKEVCEMLGMTYWTVRKRMAAVGTIHAVKKDSKRGNASLYDSREILTACL